MDDKVKYERIEHWETVINENDLKQWYEKGRKHGAIEELEKIGAEIMQMKNESKTFWNTCDTVDREELLNIIDKHITELKGSD